MNLSFFTSAEFIAGLMAMQLLALVTMSLWTIYNFDKDDKKHKKPHKLKKA